MYQDEDLSGSSISTLPLHNPTKASRYPTLVIFATVVGPSQGELGHVTLVGLPQLFT
jgi:hypothetical protein